MTRRTEWGSEELQGEFMEYSWKSHKDRNKNRKKRSGQAQLVSVKNINRNSPTTWRRVHTDPPNENLVSWCFEPSQQQRITSGLNTNFTLSPSYSFHKSSYHKSCLFVFKPIYILQALNMGTCIWQGDLFYSAGLHRNQPNQPRRNRERFCKNCRWMDWKGRNKQGKKPWQ